LHKSFCFIFEIFSFTSLKSTVEGYHDKEVNAIHQKGSIYLGFRNGFLFSYRVINEKEKFSEILFSLDLAHRIADTGRIKTRNFSITKFKRRKTRNVLEELNKDDEFYLFSTNGKEAIAVICGPKTYYRIYNINPRNGIKIIYLKKSKMTIVKQLNKKCRKVDYDAKQTKLIFFMDSSTSHELKMTLNHDGVLKSYADPKLNRFDNFRGSQKPFEGIESQWPLHLRNGRTLFYNENSNQKVVSHTKILTNYGNYVKALLYFPNEYIENEYLETFRNRSQKFPISFYGISNCTVFVIMKYEDFNKIDLKGNGCDRSYQMRAIFLDSYITVLRTKDGENVQGVRIKASIDYQDVENGMKTSDGLVAYTHNLIDSEFEKNNSFTIAPNTFHTIHNIGEYTYYQSKPRKACTYYFQRRKITKSAQKDIKDLRFSALAHPCNFEMSSAMYDESVPGVVYVMRYKNESAFVTPNTIITDTLKHIQHENFLTYFIYSTSYPYVLFNHTKGASVISVENPSDIKITFNSTFDAIGIYTGKILYREAETAHILHSEIDAVEERINDTVAVTKAVAKQDFEKAAFGEESEIIGRPEFHTKKCRLVNAPFFMAFILKISVLDMLLLLLLIILIIYHRAHIIPARRRYKIKMGILKHRKKRKLRDRARRRLRRLNVLRHRQQMRQQEAEAKRQAQLIVAAVGQLGTGQKGAGAAAKQKKKSSSSSSSDLVTAGADEHDKVPTSLTLMNTYLISGGMLFSCCILPLLYFWLCHPISKGEKLALEETQVDEVEQTEFVADEAPDRVNIRRDPLFDDVKIKVHILAFHRRHHHLLRPLHRRQQQQQQKQDSKKVPPIGKTQENSKEINESGSNAPEEKGSHAAESSFHRSGKEQLTSTEITH
uniref:Sema domain-containing protein n=1 Tax=Elaeophora elaphi TaxID=1147741 RepID=A0A158Q6W4_9BILA